MPETPDDPLLHLTRDVEEVLQDATRRILTLLDRHERALLARVEQHAVAVAPSRAAAREMRERIREAAEAALLPMAPARGIGRVSTNTVAEALQALIGVSREGRLASELRDETGYSAMQIHRAITQLEEAGDVERVGSQRRTRVRPTRKLRRRIARRSQARAGPPSVTARPRNEIESDLLRLLGRRKRGLGRVELMDRSGYSAAQVRRVLGTLRQRGLVETLGAGRNTRYRRCR